MDYEIIVPSRRRAKNIPPLLRLLPGATICVDEREEADYAPVTPGGQLLLHPPLPGAPAVRNWILRDRRAPILVMCDDDFTGFQALLGAGRFIANGEEVMAIVLNSMRVCVDLGLSAFCYSRTANTTITQPQHEPIRGMHPVYGLFGIRGAARRRPWDETLPSRADLDWSMRTLLEDRIVYCDMRFYADFGASFSGAGGNTGLVTAEGFEESSRILKQRWGRHLSFRPPNWARDRQAVTGSIRVRRKGRAAQR